MTDASESIDLAELERLAKAATPGMWGIEAYSNAVVVAGKCPPVAIAEQVYMAQDREFIIAADPDTVLALVARVREAEARIEKVREMHKPVDIEPSDTICAECSFRLPNGRYFGKVTEWPCETVKALTEGDEQ